MVGSIGLFIKSRFTNTGFSFINYNKNQTITMNHFSKRTFTLLAIVAIAFSACKKIKTAEPMGDAGQTLVKIIGAGAPFAVVKDPVSFVNTPQTLTKGVVDIRRDVPNNAELNKTMTVVVKADAAAVTAANAAYTILPSAWYTLTVADNVAQVGDSWTFTFKPGEFAKQIYVNIPNAQLLDPSALYALGFTITSVDAGGIISSQKTMVIEIGAKNNWDGVYAVTGPMVDVVNPLLVQWNNSLAGITGDPFLDAHGGAWELHLVTTGANTVAMFDNTIWGDFFHPIWATPGNSGYGSFALVVNFNPATNNITSVTNYYGQPAANTRAAALDPSGVNAVQGNKDILIKYFMLQSSLVPAPPHIRTTFDEKWEYVGPR
jgi:Domain of unknown function (DUF1735)